MKKFTLFTLIFLSGVFLTLIGCDGGGGGGVEPPPVVIGTELRVDIMDATIPPNRKPVVTFKLTDELGNPVSVEDVRRIRLVISFIAKGDSQYTDYLTNEEGQPSSEDSTEGILQRIGEGLYEYTFDFALPEGYDRNVTHTVGIYADREVTVDFVTRRFFANSTFDFVPTGAAVTVVRDVVRTVACNNCHDPLAFHGGSRRAVQLCVLCHTPQNIDPENGNTADFKVMVHKIHMGANLPSVEAGMHYEIGGRDYSHVEFPQDIRNCTKCHTSEATQADAFKDNPTRAACGSCHDDVNFESGNKHGGGIQLNDFNCSGCHLPSTGKEFDLSVVGAHKIPVKSVQVPGVIFEIVKVESAETRSDTVAPGETPRVIFSIRNNTGEVINPADMNFLRLTLAGPTTDYYIQDYNGDGVLTPGDPLSPWTPNAEDYKQEDPRASASGPDGSGNFTYTFSTMIPANASGTYTIGIEGYKCATVQGASQRKGGINCDGTKDPNGNGQEDPGEAFNQVRDAGHNVVHYFAVTDSQPVARRMVVDTSTKCIACHGVFSKDFSIHGGVRNDSEYCVLCHNPSHDTLSRQLPPVGETGLTNSVDFKVMLHKIHTGENLTMKPYLLYSPPRGPFPDQVERAVDFSEVLFPGETADCGACHLAGTNLLKRGTGVLGAGVMASTSHEFMREESSKTVIDTFFTEPVISVCTACHDDLGVNAAGDALTGENHAGGPQPESACIVCHGVGEPLDVEVVHLRFLPPDERPNRPRIIR